jgi:hypothetical protein
MSKSIFNTGGTNSFDQDLNTTDPVTFTSVDVNGFKWQADGDDLELKNTLDETKIKVKENGEVVFVKDTGGTSQGKVVFSNYQGQVGFETNSAEREPQLVYTRSDGTTASKTEVKDGMVIGSNFWIGHTSSVGKGPCAIQTVTATEDFSAAARGVEMSLVMVDKGSTALVPKITHNENGTTINKALTLDAEAGTKPLQIKLGGVEKASITNAGVIESTGLAIGDYTFPPVSGSVGQTLILDGSSALTWGSGANQSLNTTDSPSFVQVNAKLQSDSSNYSNAYGDNIDLSTVSTGGNVIKSTRKRRNSLGDDSPLLTDDKVLSISTRCLEESKTTETSSIKIIATQSHGADNLGVSMAFSTTDNGSRVNTEKLRLDSDGVNVVGNLKADSNVEIDGHVIVRGALDTQGFFVVRSGSVTIGDPGVTSYTLPYSITGATDGATLQLTGTDLAFVNPCKFSGKGGFVTPGSYVSVIDATGRRGSLTVPSSSWHIGTTFRVSVCGMYATDETTSDFTMDVTLGGNIVSSTGKTPLPDTSAVLTPFKFEMQCTLIDPTLASFCKLEWSTGNSVAATIDQTSTLPDVSISSDWDIMAKWDTVGGTKSAYVSSIYIEKIV